MKRERQELKVDKEDKKVDIQTESNVKETKEESDTSDGNKTNTYYRL